MTKALCACAAFLAGCATPPPAGKPADQPPADNPAAASPSGRDLADLSLAAMRLQAQVDRQVLEHQVRPRRRFIGARASEYRFAAYEEKWRAKIESVGAANFPPEARGRTANVRVTVTIRADGAVESIEIDRSSGDKVFDSAVTRIVRQAAPFEAFPPDIRRDTDLLVITRTWFFGSGGAVTGRGEP